MTPPLKSTADGKATPFSPAVLVYLASQKLGQMAGDGRVRRVGQAHFAHADLGLLFRIVMTPHLGKEALQQNGFDLAPGQLGADRAADQRRAAAKNDDRFGLQASGR